MHAVDFFKINKNIFYFFLKLSSCDTADALCFKENL